MPVTTRPSNANMHPGQVVRNAGQKRRTKAEKAADDKRLREELEAKEAAAVQGIERLAKIQATMEESQASVTNKKPMAVRPRPCAIKKSVAASPKEAKPALNQAEDASGQEALTMEIDGDYRSIKDAKVASKRSLKDAVDAAHLKLRRENLFGARVTDGKGTLFPSEPLVLSLNCHVTAF